MKTITLTGSWLMSFPEQVRRYLLRDIFELGDEKKWLIRVAGQHWEA